LVALIGDVRRFARPNRLVGYLGLDPIVRQSGGRAAYTGHISHAGQGHVRGLLVEAALGAVKAPGPLHAFYARVPHRLGPGIAIIAVARKLTVLAWHLLSQDVDYRWAPARLTAAKIRRIELDAGAPSRRGRAPGSGHARERARRERQQDPAVLAQAEAASVALVEARLERDAAAANGERLSSAKAEPGKAARRSQIPKPPPFATGSTASRINDTPPMND
jgi:transposase